MDVVSRRLFNIESRVGHRADPAVDEVGVNAHATFTAPIKHI
jgi:hypothetical protein